ncbi:MAG: prepilin peptidase [Bacilli bacterium]|nr:prepilin peptidase [Bacilli bacterium]
MDLIDVLYMGFLFVFGAVIGSFLNVLIYRLPNKMSIIKPGSHCFNCGAPIKWYDNIPIISYLILGGKCRNCKKHYSCQYFLIELFTATMYVLSYVKYRNSLLTIASCLVISCLIVIFFIDLRHFIIPDSMIIGILIVSVACFFIKDTNIIASISDRLWSLAVVVGAILLLLLLGKIIKKDLMGFGDFKLFGVIGLLIGFKLLLLGIFVAAVIAVIVEVIILRKKDKPIPFGPYLAVGFTLMLFFGNNILDWYSSLFR